MIWRKKIVWQCISGFSTVVHCSKLFISWFHVKILSVLFSNTLYFIGVRKWLRVNLTLFLLWEKICAFTWNSSSISHRFWTWTCHFIDNNRKKIGHKKFSLSFDKCVCVIFTRNSELENLWPENWYLQFCKTDLRKKRVG